MSKIVGNLFLSEKLDFIERMIDITYGKLVATRDAAGLTPGQLYRITDYAATTNGNGGSGAETAAVFDIIVRAEASGALSEHAKAARRAGTTYFPAGVKFEAWKVQYCLDNDSSRFAWAAENGKGVVYRLVDEFGNDCPYDFKGLKFNVPDQEETFFTFSVRKSESPADGSLDASNKFYGNVIQPYVNGGVRWLNNIVAAGKNCNSNTFGKNCRDIYFEDDDCYRNDFGDNCHDVKFGYGSSSNVLEDNCSDIVFGFYCSGNRIGVSTSGVSFGDYCQGNTIGFNCQNVSFTGHCKDNVVGARNKNVSFRSKDTSSAACCNNVVEYGNSGLSVVTVGKAAAGPGQQTRNYMNVTFKTGYGPALVNDPNYNQNYPTVYSRDDKKRVSPASYTKITWSDDTTSSLYVSGKFDKSNLAGKQPASIAFGAGVTAIATQALSRCSNLTGVAIPDTVSSVGDWAFNGTSVKSVKVPSSVQELGQACFYQVSSLESLSVGAAKIGEYAFDGCTGLTGVTLFDGVRYVEKQAFAACRALKDVELPASVVSVGLNAFSGCAQLTSVVAAGKTRDQALAMLANAGVNAGRVRTKNAATQEWTNEQGYLTEHQSLSGYAKTSDVQERVRNAAGISAVQKITQAEYDALGQKDPATLYVIA